MDMYTIGLCKMCAVSKHIIDLKPPSTCGNITYIDSLVNEH